MHHMKICPLAWEYACPAYKNSQYRENETTYDQYVNHFTKTLQ